MTGRVATTAMTATNDKTVHNDEGLYWVGQNRSEAGGLVGRLLSVRR
jgi:hypothetical protein